MRSTDIKLIVFASMMTVFSISSCKKQAVHEGQPVSLTIFNGLDNGIDVYGNYSDLHPIVYASGQRISNRGALQNVFETSDIRARYFASPDTMAKDAPLLEKLLNLEPGKSYSMYLMADRSAVEDLLIENKFKGFKNDDSVTYLQVVNVSNDQPVSVNIKDNPDGNFINTLAYKGASDFIELKANHTTPSYEFEFRDAATGELLATTMVQEIYGGTNNRFLYKNWTLVFTGKRGATDMNAIDVRRIHHNN